MNSWLKEQLHDIANEVTIGTLDSEALNASQHYQDMDKHCTMHLTTVLFSRCFQVFLAENMNTSVWQFTHGVSQWNASTTTQQICVHI